MISVCFLRTSTFFNAIRTVQTTTLRTLSTMANPRVFFDVHAGKSKTQDINTAEHLGVRYFFNFKLIFVFTL